MSDDRRFEESLYHQQQLDIKELRMKNKQLRSLVATTHETIDGQNELLGEIQTDMDSAAEKLRKMKEKTKLALRKVGKKGAICGTLGTLGLFALLWLLLA